MQNTLFGTELDKEINSLDNKITISRKAVNELITDLDDIEEDDDDTELEKVLKSNKISIRERLAIISRNVLLVLGKQRRNIIVIKSRQQLHDYITAAINSGRISIDTETNNSLDPVTCLLAGGCLYYPGGKQAYIPINHRDPITKERLSWQCTEQDLQEEFQRILDVKVTNLTKGGWMPDYPGQSYQDWYDIHITEVCKTLPTVVMHNGKFDYEVIKSTCGIGIVPDWDTMIGQRLLDENDQAGLKYLYTHFIDPGQAKYDIDKLFVNVSYLDVDPDIFALYAATDSMMTDKVYLWELAHFFNIMDEVGNILPLYVNGAFPTTDLLKPDKERLYKLFTEVEMPIVTITAKMEMTGVSVDQELGSRLQIKYSKQLAELDSEIETTLALLSDTILKWRLSKEANEYPKQFQPKNSKKSLAQIEHDYPLIDQATGKRYNISKKCLKDKLSDPIRLSSSTQMAILFYDILGIEPFDKKKPRGTGEDAIETIKEILEVKATEAGTWLNPDIKPTAADLAYLEQQAKPFKAAKDLCVLILKRRGIVKLITTYIDTIPTLVKHWPDGRIRFHLNSLGTDTGRYSSGGKLKFMENDTPVEVSGINIQNIPSHCKEVRLLFKAQTTFNEYNIDDTNSFIVHEYEELETNNGWKYPKDIIQGDELITDEGNKLITNLLFDSEQKLYRILL